MTQVNLELDNVLFTVWGYYEPAEPADRDYPGCNSSFSIQEVYLSNSSEDENIVDFLKETVLDDLSDKACLTIEGN